MRETNDMLNIAQCPSCNSERIGKVQRDVTREFEGQTYTVPQLTFYECQECGERIYDPEAVRKIEDCSPAFAETHMSK